MSNEFMCEVTVDILMIGWVWLSFTVLPMLAYICLNQMIKISKLRLELASLEMVLEDDDR